MLAIIVKNPKSDTPEIFGLFKDGNEATLWGGRKFGICGDWFWCNLIDPKSPYAEGLPNFQHDYPRKQR